MRCNIIGEKKKRIQLSFGKSKEDEEIYNYLTNDVSNASALIRMLVRFYKDGAILSSTTGIHTCRKDIIDIFEEKKSHEEDKQKFNDSFEKVKSWLEALKI